MGTHKPRKAKRRVGTVHRRRKVGRLPPAPTNIGERRSHPMIDGRLRRMTVEDEIHRRQRSALSPKLLYFQKVRFDQGQRLQYRLTYYMLGVKPGRRGRWVFGQFSPFIPASDLRALMKEARRRKWPGI